MTVESTTTINSKGAKYYNTKVAIKIVLHAFGKDNILTCMPNTN